MGCYEIAHNVIVCTGPEMQEHSRRSMGERWCFTHRKREHFDSVVYAPVEMSYYGPDLRIEGPTPDCSDLFPGWTREWDE